MTPARTYTLTALTDIWTGDASGKGEKLITTGLLGSIRWWFEVVVRGLGGSACDPTQTNCQDREHCVACELFGCTGWARKHRFDVLGEDGETLQDKITANQRFQLRFTRMRPMKDKEWALLDLTIRLIAEHAAIGAKTVFKPSDEQDRQNAFHHKDFGLIKLEEIVPDATVKTNGQLCQYVTDSCWRPVDHDGFEWASLLNFWCVKGRYLARQNSNNSSFNRVIGRPEPKAQAHKNDPWLAGRRPSRGGEPESKRVFSFKDPVSARRTFGFVQSANKLDEMKQRLKEKAWNDLKDDEFLTGAEILRRLLGQGGYA